MITCTGCGKAKPAENFYADPSKRSGRFSACKPCTRARQKARVRTDPEHTKAYKREYARRWRKLNPGRWKPSPKARENARWAHIKREYGLTKAQYEQLLEQQNRLCAICKDTPPSDVDHCHSSGKIRGLLCGGCNKAIGLLKDRADVAARAAEYLVWTTQK